MSDDLALSVEVETASGRRYLWAPESLSSDDVPVDLDFRTQRGEGFADGGVTLHRRIDQDWPDLSLIDTIRFIGPDGSVAYEGQHIRNPRSVADGHSIQLEVGGWMKHATHRTFQEVYADRSAANWVPPTLNARIENAIAGHVLDNDFQASAEGAVLRFDGSKDRSIPNNSRALLMYVMPEACRAAAFAYRLRQDNAGGNYADPILYATDDDTNLLSAQDQYTLSASTSVQTQDLTSARRFLTLALIRSATGTPTAAAKRHYTTPAVYGNHGLDKRDNGDEPDGFYASDVIRDIVSRFCPKLSADGVEDTAYTISHIAWPESTTPYDAIQELAAYHLYNLGVWEDRTLHFAPYDLTTADWHVRYDDEGVTVNLQGDSTEGLRNGVVVEFTDVKTGLARTLYPADYEQLRDDSDSNPANRHGIELWSEPISVPFPCSESDALQLGEIALEDSVLPKASGSISVTGYVRDARGNRQPAWKVRAGDTIAITNFPNDRPRLIADTSWNHGSKALTVNVELPSQSVEALYARIANRRQARGLS